MGCRAGRRTREHGTRTQGALIALLLTAPAIAPAVAAGFEAGLASGDLTPPVGVPLAGYTARWRVPDWLGLDPYAHYLDPSEGVLDPIRAKALWLRAPDAAGAEVEVLVVALDTIGIDPVARERVALGLEGAGASPDLLLLSATHTHSGPGDLSPNGVYELLVTDRFEDAVTLPFVAGVVEVALEARSRLEPVALSTLEVTTAGVQKNRVWKPDGEVDDGLRLLLVTREGDDLVLGALANYAVHGTVLDEDNLLYSGDLPGAIAAALEQKIQEERGGDPVVLFLNGSEGDVAPVPGDASQMHAAAQTLAGQVIPVLDTAAPLSGAVAIRAGDAWLGRAFLSFGNCGIGPWSRWGLSVDASMPDAASIWQVDLGPLRWLTVPGEPTTRIGSELRTLFDDQDGVEVWILGLTNDHLGYFGKPDEYGSHATGCGTLYGPNGGDKLVKGHRCLLGGCVQP